MILSLLVYGGLGAASLAVVWRLLASRRSRPAALPVAEARVVVRGGYEPDTIVAVAGRPLRITFRREDTLACSERVVFPDFGKSAMLPPHEDVTVELVPELAGEFEFTCQMGMLRGRLVVIGDELLRAAALGVPPAVGSGALVSERADGGRRSARSQALHALGVRWIS